MAVSLVQLADQLRSEGDAYRYLEQLRWNGQPVCPHCGAIRKHYFLTPKNGVSRKTRTGSTSERRVWKCADCRKQFTVLVGTIFHRTKIPVRTWCFLVFEMAASKNGISAREVERKYGLCPRTAWFALHRLREAMKRNGLPHPDNGVDLLRGRVVADESYLGGKPANRHGHDPGKHRRGVPDGKIQILTLVSRETGEARSRIVPNVRRNTLREAIAEQVEIERTHLHTDQLGSYKAISRLFRQHSAVDHSAREYVRGDVSTNQVEAYFAQLKRSIDGTHHHVSREHLERYLAEFDFRYSTCKASDTERMMRIVEQTAGRRLAYQQAR
jgi:transposase-like protein